MQMSLLMTISGTSVVVVIVVVGVVVAVVVVVVVVVGASVVDRLMELRLPS